MDSSNSSEPTVDFNAFVATETGLLKAVHINPKNNIVKTFHNLQNGITKEEKISAMGWGNRNEILLGLHNQTVKVFDPEEKRYITSFNAAVTQGGPLRGVAKVDNVLLTAANTGTVTLWKNKEQDRITFNTVDTEVCATGKLKKGDFHDEEEKATFLEQIKTGRTLHRMRTHQTEKHLILTGGKENGLQVWDLTRPDQPMFKAKNVKHDALDLRVPVWITDLCFTDPLSAKQVACTNKYGHIRLYDVRAESSQRRPTMEVMFPEDTPTAMAPTPNIDQVSLTETWAWNFILKLS